MYALLPILALLATVNAAPVAINNNVEVVEKRACLPFDLLCINGGATTTAKAATTTTAAAATTNTKAATTTTATTTGNIINTVVNAPAAVVTAVLKCPLDPTGLLGLCKDANTGATTTTAVVVPTTTAVVVPTTTANAGNVINTIATVPVAVVTSVVTAVLKCPLDPTGLLGLCKDANTGATTTAVVVPTTAVVVPTTAVVVPTTAVVVPTTAVVVPTTAVVVPTTVVPTTVIPTTTAVSPSPSPVAPGNANVANWAYTSCIQEGSNGRALTGSSFGGSGMTVESCLASCDAGGFMFAGLEYGQECWCGSTLANGAALTKTGTCDMACSGNAKELCGGSSTLSLYTSTKVKTPAQAPALPAGWASTTCMNEVSGRAFTKSSFASDDMTVNKCIAFCGSGSKYAAVEYGRECYCGTSVDNGASLTSTSGQCNVPCAGLASQTCGGPNALQVYTNAGYKSASAGAYSNTGCVQEVDGRLLRGASIASDNMTIETCTSFCQSQGFAIAGLEYAKECYCGSSYVSTPLQSGQCNMPCAGNSGQNCGGPNALNIFTLGGI